MFRSTKELTDRADSADTRVTHSSGGNKGGGANGDEDNAHDEEGKDDPFWGEERLARRQLLLRKLGIWKTTHVLKSEAPKNQLL